jgi:bacillithiol biosynthesis deacetylase BshB1
LTPPWDWFMLGVSTQLDMKRRGQMARARSKSTFGRENPNSQSVDVLAFGTHPDDIEITCAGTLLKLRRLGWRIGAVDLTRGELGTRGSAEIRAKETAEANRILRPVFRVNLGIPDGNIALDQENLLMVIQQIRQHRPRLILAPHWEERHYDHVHASRLISEAAFYSGLPKIETGPPAWRPFRVLYYLGRVGVQPSFVVDISETFTDKMKALRCYSTQVHRGGSAKLARGARSAGPATLISTPYAMQVFETLTRYYGAMIGTAHGEPFVVREALELADPVEYFNSFPSDRQAHLFSGR